MDKEILELLKEMNSKLDKIDSRVNIIESEVKEVNRKLERVVDQTADLTEFKTIVIDKLDNLIDVEEVTKENCYDIAKLKRNIKRA
ncbi:MAG: plasmid stabilization protein [Sarcina sp.]